MRQRSEAAHGRRQEPRCWENFKPTATLCRMFTLSASDTDLCLAWFVAVFHIASLLVRRVPLSRHSPSHWTLNTVRESAPLTHLLLGSEHLVPIFPALLPLALLLDMLLFPIIDIFSAGCTQLSTIVLRCWGTGDEALMPTFKSEENGSTISLRCRAVWWVETCVLQA